MKKLGLAFVTLILLASSGYSSVKDIPRFACTLNRSVELWFVEYPATHDEGAGLEVLKKVNAAKAEQVAYFSQAFIAEHRDLSSGKDVWAALARDEKFHKFDRGFVLVRVQQNEDREGNITYTGHLDVDLRIPGQDTISTNGQLLETQCRSLN